MTEQRKYFSVRQIRKAFEAYLDQDFTPKWEVERQWGMFAKDLEATRGPAAPGWPKGKPRKVTTAELVDVLNGVRATSVDTLKSEDWLRHPIQDDELIGAELDTDISEVYQEADNEQE